MKSSTSTSKGPDNTKRNCTAEDVKFLFSGCGANLRALEGGSEGASREQLFEPGISRGGGVMGKNHGKTMEKPWKTMVSLWETNRTRWKMAVEWDFDGIDPLVNGET